MDLLMFLLYPNHLVILLAIFIRVLKIMMLQRFQRKWAVKAINNHFLFWFLFSRLVFHANDICVAEIIKITIPGGLNQACFGGHLF